jgi:hypothetical protein
MKQRLRQKNLLKRTCLSATKPGAMVDLARREALALYGETKGVEARARASTLIELLMPSTSL